MQDRELDKALAYKALSKISGPLSGTDTRSTDAFIVRAQAALAPTGPYPVELSAGKEPAWHADELTGDNLHREIRITPKRCVE
ncbi:hypothetical protein C1X33_22635 [Pseudomonas sp. GW460-E13]|nr:hypothetical protein C1X56_25385 [Pseudomonas sp. GW101-1A09]PMW30899.1 hypothetical protein C1X45_26265 [Pseudomonas sp. GW460-7]PMW36709.1 hypothetical protein C1X48_15680 [Pseudomonas sp. FW305-3-2-15-A-R2A1]PMW52010.1 hypothetical protein C1X41_14275 [Pseudomonas sp. GW460-11-11-14-LB11]PMW79674.1 hypothetical protein C1X36_09220 [Pseudomonas sp. GW460-8]PMW84434.1 hypothetical protein C1X32_23460 [Pseudomonas sp. GW460-12-1-14-LB3]PMW93891.1 hypothetical protein C1X33_22635 [Pseudomon